jgi:hypothetical protein
VKAPVKNVTLSLPEPLLREFRIYAATQDRSMTALMTDAIAKMVGQDAEREKAGRRVLERIRRAPDRGVGGKITWTREELHDR